MILIWSVVPILMLAWFITTLTTEWWSNVRTPSGVLRFVTNPSTVTVWAMMLGFNLAVLVAPVVATRESPQEPHAQS